MTRTTLLFLFLLLGMHALGDVVTLKDGRQIVGSVESGTETTIRITSGSTAQDISVDQIQSIRLDSRRPVETVLNAPSRTVPNAAPGVTNTNPAAAEQKVLGVVYWQDTSGVLIPLERLTAKQNGQLFEIRGRRSEIRIPENTHPVFVVRLQNGSDPTTFKLYPLGVNSQVRITSVKAQTLDIQITRLAQSTYRLVPTANLWTGEYAFSPTTSNESYCFGIERSAAPTPRAAVSAPPISPNPYGATSTVPRPTQPDPIFPDAIIAAARSAATTFSADLPDFFAKLSTTRYTGPASADHWKPLDTVTAEVTWVHGEESYRNIKIDGSPAERPENAGHWSTLDFQDVLTNILSPITAAPFVPALDSSVENRPVWVFDYKVEQSRSNWTVKDNASGQSYKPAYEGQISIDKKLGKVVRVQMKAVDLPPGFDVAKAEMSVEFGYRGILVYSLVPVQSTSLRCSARNSVCALTQTDFAGYRKYQ
jgi:hypothetical protein